MKKQPAKKRATKKPRKRSALLHGNPIGDAIAKAARHGEEENFLAAMKRRCDAAEQKAARLEEHIAVRDQLHKQQLIKWQDTVKLRDEAIGRKEQRIQELVGQLRLADSKVADQAKELDDLRAQIGIEWGDGGFLPPGKTFREVLGAEVEARKQAQEELGVAMRDLRQYEHGQKKMAADLRSIQEANATYANKAHEDESTIATLSNEIADLHSRLDRLARKDDGPGSEIYNQKVMNHNMRVELRQTQGERDRLRKELDQARAAKTMWEGRADVLADELARYKKPPTADEPHHQVTEWTLTFADLAEFVRLFKPADGG